MSEENAVGEIVRQTVAEGYHEIEERYLDLRDQAYLANLRAMQLVEEHPLACIAGAFSVGFLIAKFAKSRWLV